MDRFAASSLSQSRWGNPVVTSLKTLVLFVEMKNFCRVAKYLLAQFWMKPMKALKSGKSNTSAPSEPASPRQEVRCAVRFPLELPAVVSAGKTEFAAHTRNISASGALLELDRQLQTGLDIRFSLRMPGPVLGTPHDVLVHCLGRVVRCCLSQTQYLAAATIDEYKFAEQ